MRSTIPVLNSFSDWSVAGQELAISIIQIEWPNIYFAISAVTDKLGNIGTYILKYHILIVKCITSKLSCYPLP